ncbi:MAG: hypothetical protein NUV46_01320 [Nanoarchaeota archaeon]|nr:hypothetical protein [Nanoarchaeota archaeon]
MSKKKGLSQIVSTVLIVLITVALIAGFWAIINSYINSNLNRASACNDIFEKVSINPDYTCYDSSSNSMLISISRSEFEMDSLFVSVSNESESMSFTLENTPKLIDGVVYYYGVSVVGEEVPLEVSLPGNESGRTYCFSGVKSKPSLIDLSPKRFGFQCGVVDSVNEIPFCPTNIFCEGSPDGAR